MLAVLLLTPKLSLLPNPRPQDDRKYVPSSREGMYDDLAYYDGAAAGQRGRGNGADARGAPRLGKRSFIQSEAN